MPGHKGGLVLEVKEKKFKDFFDVPFKVYGNSSKYISPLKSDLKRFLDNDVNPLLKKFGKGTYFTVYRDGQLLGRITAHIHQASNDLYGWKKSYFGFFDCAEDYQAASLLLKYATNWARQQNQTHLIGNFNQTAMQQMGVMVDGFDATPYTDQLYSPPHIAEFLRKQNFQESFPMKTFELSLIDFSIEDKFNQKHRDWLVSEELQFRKFNRKEGYEILKDTRIILNDGFQNNPWFVPVTEEEFFFQAKDMMTIVDPRISCLVYRGGAPVGVVVCIPDLNHFLKKTKSRYRWDTPYHYLKHRLTRQRAVIIFYSVAQAAQGLGLNGAMLLHVITCLKKATYTKLGITWIGSENPASLRQMERLGAENLHELRLFEKKL